MTDTIRRLADSLQSPVTGTVGAPYRGTLAELIGTGGNKIQRLAELLDRAAVTVPGINARVSLKDMTLGDSGQVIEDATYGMPPVTGGNYATGGIGTYGVDPQALELLNLGGMVGAGGKLAKRVIR